MTARLDLRDVSAGYGASTVLRDVTFAAEPGQRVAVLGPNGGGKTTLFRVLTGELPARTGAVERDGAIAIVPQTERTRLDFPVSALDVVLMGTISTRPWWRGTRRADRERARRALGRVGLADRAGDRFGTLSGGQRQRVLVARALVRDAAILLLDEPFAGLDATSADELERLFADLAAEGRILLIATHDVAQARRWDRVLCLRGRQVAHGVPGAVLDGPTIVATYGDGVLRLPDQDGLVVLADHHDHHHA